MSAQLFFLPYPTIPTSNGLPIAGAQVRFRVAGTTTLSPVYTDSGLTTPHTNPVVTNAAGRLPPIYLDSEVSYRVDILDEDGAELDSIDPYLPGTLYIGDVTGDDSLALRNDLLDDDGASHVNFSPDAGTPSYLSMQSVIRNSPIITPQMFGAVGDGVTDDYAAIMEAIDHATFTVSGDTAHEAGAAVYFPPAFYLCNTPIQLKKSVRLYGDGSAHPYSVLASLTFPPGVSGIIVHESNTTGITVETPATTSAIGTIIENLRFIGDSSVAGDAYGGVGIRLRTKALLRNVSVFNFRGTGILLAAQAGGGGALEGNVNCTRIEGGAAYGCQGYGLRFDGADANACLISNFDASNNSNYGISDNSFLGNTFVGCHTAGNGVGAYQASSINARSVFLGCYSESDQPTSVISGPSMVIGGLHGAGVTGPHLSVNSAADPFFNIPSIDADVVRLVTVNHSSGSAAPASGTYTKGDIVWNTHTNPANDAIDYWKCTVSGSPGTFVARP